MPQTTYRKTTYNYGNGIRFIYSTLCLKSKKKGCSYGATLLITQCSDKVRNTLSVGRIIQRFDPSCCRSCHRE